MLDAHKHALRVELPLFHNLAEVGLLLMQLEGGQAERHLDDLVEVLKAADARVGEDRLRTQAAKQASLKARREGQFDSCTVVTVAKVVY